MIHLDNLEKYIHHDEKDSLVQLAIVHAQFELIHPFTDGNGRVGRILIPLFLYSKQLLSNPMFYLSEYLEINRKAYCDRLQAISSEGDWNGWISFFLAAIIEQAQKNIDKAKAILALYDQMKLIVPKITHSQYAIHAIDTLFDHPLFTSTDFIRRSNIPKGTALRLLKALQEKQLIFVIREGRGRIPPLLIFRKLLDIVG